MNPAGQVPQPPQKLIDFNNELKALCDKYQYEVKAVLQIAPDSTAIVAAIQVYDKSPMNGGVNLQPTPAAAEEVAPVVDTPLVN